MPSSSLLNKKRKTHTRDTLLITLIYWRRQAQSSISCVWHFFLLSLHKIKNIHFYIFIGIFGRARLLCNAVSLFTHISLSQFETVSESESTEKFTSYWVSEHWYFYTSCNRYASFTKPFEIKIHIKRLKLRNSLSFTWQTNSFSSISINNEDISYRIDCLTRLLVGWLLLRTILKYFTLLPPPPPS